MAEYLTKLRPDRDLQCYFQQPSAIAALSETGPDRFTVSGCWRQQFDWAVVEWNRDNVFEHPALRNLPDGNLSGLVLTYEEMRSNCLPIDSTSYDSIGWSCLRIWEESNGIEQFHRVALRPHGVPIAGTYQQPTAQFELQGSPTPGDYVELSWLDQHFNYLVAAGDSLEAVVTGLTGFINAAQSTGGVIAVSNGRTLTLTYLGSPGTNGNRVGVYGGVSGAETEYWSPSWSMFQGGTSPERWRVTLDFGNLTDTEGRPVPTSNVRKLRWTWAADLQVKNFLRSEFAAVISNWQVTGSGLAYSVAGPGSRRIEDNASEVHFLGNWIEEKGNYSGGSIRYATRNGDELVCSYTASDTHQLYAGTRSLGIGGSARIQVDGGTWQDVNLERASEDVLVRVPIGEFAGGTSHAVRFTHAGPDYSRVYFDFLEVAYPTQALPDFDPDPVSTLATDWDTDHALALAPERTGWLIEKLGFHGRANHYVGAMWFYELHCPGNQYASATVQFSGVPQFGGSVQITLGGTTITHPILIGDTSERIAKCFELLIAAGSSAVWAEANGSVLQITARTPGASGNSTVVSASTNCEGFAASASGATLTGGMEGVWQTDLQASPRLNRAVRDWSRSYYRHMRSKGIEMAPAFSMELRHGDDRLETGIAQRYPSGPVWLNTPALQTNFGPESRAFWRDVYRDMAAVMVEAEVPPYLQFGEVQWWYFADSSGMPFYDDYTKSRFQAAYGRDLATIPTQHADPSLFPQECGFLPTLIGEFTTAVMEYVRQFYPATRFEVLYPPDTNDTPLNRLINFPHLNWTPTTLACLKTENFTYTGDRNLDKARESIRLPGSLGFPAWQSSHLIGITDPTAPWSKEHNLSVSEGCESVVLFALDQFCLIGYKSPLARGPRHGQFMGA